MPSQGMNHDMPNPYVAPGLHNNISPGALNSYRGPMVSVCPIHSLDNDRLQWQARRQEQNSLFFDGTAVTGSRNQIQPQC